MAAGRSQRFGDADKRLAVLPDGRTLLAATMERAAEVFPLVRVVLREDDDRQALGVPEKGQVIRAPHGGAGLGASLADAFVALARDTHLANCEAAAIVLADMPFIQVATLRTLLCDADPSRIVRPRHGGRPGHPVLFGRDFWLELTKLDGDEGGRAIIRQHMAQCREIDVDDPGIHADIDLPEDIA
ncbi:hypothetical protein GCM10007160_05010 [Litchfieldella qijiaojingensis]|uniref:MobA-like NTP transferase domain-containing protein n=2 Tax=Litchfieldella qijiaojingensis TaxID=980347 RepID=A0ABQ2YEQ8_9GAMM|nr:hypothetical protein GCM10007160_05010 [Halomonas qijiaojingensis]